MLWGPPSPLRVDFALSTTVLTESTRGMAQETTLCLHMCVSSILSSGDWSLKGVLPHQVSENSVLLLQRAKLDVNQEKRTVPLHGTVGHRRGLGSPLVCGLSELSWRLDISLAS